MDRTDLTVPGETGSKVRTEPVNLKYSVTTVVNLENLEIDKSKYYLHYGVVSQSTQFML